MMLSGKVAGLISARELIINIGSEQGVENGMKFKVLSSEPYVITNPDNGKTLGELNREKVRVQVTEIHEKFSICSTFRKKNIGGTAEWALTSGSMVDSILNPPKYKLETLKIEDSELPPPLSEEESYVKKGDRVVQIIENDKDK